MNNAAEENWQLLLSLFPEDWERLANEQGAIRRLRGFRSAESVLRTLLLHVGNGYSLRETAVKARLAGVAEVSDVTILNRLRQAEGWLRQLCQQLMKEAGLDLRPAPGGRRVRVVDGSVIREQGRTGSQWRLHYSLQLPSLECDYLEVTPARGKGNGETLGRFPAAAGDLVLADSGYCRAPGMETLCEQKADIVVRLNTGCLPLWTSPKKPFPLLNRLRQLRAAGQVKEWEVLVKGSRKMIPGRLCAIHKSEAAIDRALRRIRRKAQQGQPNTQPETLEYARYAMVFTTVPQAEMSTTEILEWYRLRWQIELVFKRLKSLARLGQLPKYDEASSRGWLYGKLLVALLSQKLIRVGRTISPWGYMLPQQPAN